MDALIGFTVRLVGAVKLSWEKKWNFFGVFAAIFLANVLVLTELDLLPQAPHAASQTVSAVATDTEPVSGPEAPVKVEVPRIGLVAVVTNPATTAAEALDEALLRGAVRYPTSASLNEAGNVVLFGHSSYLPVVGNQAYKTFDGIQKLVAGDVITVYSAKAAYAYRVRGVTKESAASDAGISLAIAGRELTLVTCNSFATKSDRFVVTADFVESHSLPL